MINLISVLIFSVFFAFSTAAFSAENSDRQNILIIGDSISAGFGLGQGESWTILLQNRLNDEKHPFNVVNASLSGDTTGGGRNRIDRALSQHNPAIVIIELGGNDGLRGLSLKTMKANLTYMIDASLKPDRKVLLVGMQLPPNYGPSYTRKFSAVYQTLANEKQISLLPFFFEGIAEDRAFFQSDQIHPNARAQSYLLDNVWKKLEPLLN